MRGECLTLTLSLGVIPCQYRRKLDSLAYISAAESIGVSSTTYVIRLQWKATELGEFTQPLGLLRQTDRQTTDGRTTIANVKMAIYLK